jgi:hypothetical protein
VFREACTRARNFTIPIVTCVRTVEGACYAGIGTAVVVNDEGWIVTAAHIVKQFSDLAAAEARTRDLETQMAAVNGDASLSAKDRKRRLNAIGRPKRTDIDRWSVWFGVDGAAVLPGLAIEAVDLAIARLVNFKLPMEYPVFKF